MSDLEIMVSEEKGVRKLHFGSEWVQGAMRVARPFHLELEYTKEMLAPLLLSDFPSPPQRVLCIGLGVGALPKFFVKYFPSTVVEVVEICPAVVSVCQMHFKLPEQTATFQIHIGCGADFIEQTAHKYDLILVDGFDEDARVGPLDGDDFYAAASGRLASNGVLVTNILAHELDPHLTVDRLGQAFEGRALALSPCKSGNVIALAWASGFDPNSSAADIQASKELVQSNTGLNLGSTASKLAAAVGSLLSTNPKE